MKLLLHCCCGPCSVMPTALLREAGHELAAYFYNPNIHPYREYKKRRNAFREFMEAERISFAIDDLYDMEDFLRRVAEQPSARCAACYEMRLRRAAEFAVREGFEGFSTTLLVSPYQKHELIRVTGEKLAAEYGIEFVYQDFRPWFRQGQDIARERGLYMQGYCGCIYSEKDRYFKPKEQPLILDNRWQKRKNLEMQAAARADK